MDATELQAALEKERAEHSLTTEQLNVALAQLRAHADAALGKPSEIPKRRHELSLKISADSLNDLCQLLDELTWHLSDDGNHSVGGGHTTGHILEHAVRPEQTHEKFAAELAAYLEKKP